MNEPVFVKYSTRVITGIQQYINTKRATFVRRVAVILLLFYFAVLVHVGLGVYGDFTYGFHFPTSGYQFFPIPAYPSTGVGISPVETPLPPFQVFIYVILIYQNILIAWFLLAVMFIMLPIFRWVYSSGRRPHSKSELEPLDRGEKVGVFTGLISIPSVLLSVETFIVNLERYGPLPLIMVLGLSTVIIVFLLIEVKNIIARSNRFVILE